VVAIVYQRWSTSGVPSVKSKSGVVDNVGISFEIVSHSTIVQSYFQFRFGGRHLESVVTNVGYVDVVIVWSAVVENVEVTVGIMSVCC